MIYLQLFLSYLKIGFFGFGGGYAMLSLIQHEVVIAHGWITNEELTDIIAVSQMTPGPISINSATYIGYVVTGSVWGAVVATAAVCLPAMTLMIVLTRFYLALRNNAYIRGVMYGMRPMILAMIALAGAVLFTPVTFIDYKSWLIFGAGLSGFAAQDRSDPADRALGRSRLSDIRLTKCRTSRTLAKVFQAPDSIFRCAGIDSPI